MAEPKTQCVQCGVEFLKSTADRTGGLCMPCKAKAEAKADRPKGIFPRLKATICEYGLALMALLIAVGVGSMIYSEGSPLPLAALFGSSVGVSLTWIFFFSAYRITMYITRGAPFRVGETVVITTGRNAGSMGVVTSLVEGRNNVFIRLEGEDHDNSVMFNWDEISKRKIKK